MNTDTPSSIASFCPSPEVVTSADEDVIKSRIFTIRGVQVMLDRDLAHLYGVETRVLNQAVKRNTDRFPAHFLFQLTKDEWEYLKSQTVTSSWGGDRGLPYTFTEQGVAMLSSVLRSPTAVKVSIQIMDVFVKMRKALASVAPLLSRLDTIERRQITDQSRNDERFDTIFKAMDGGEFPPQKVFFEGKHYDAYSFARKLVRKATKSIVLVDAYCDDSTLDLLSQKRGGADVTIATTHKSATKTITPTAVAKFNKQNPTLTIKTVGIFHDRFLILDGAVLYHLGASLKDLGRQYCAVTTMDAMFIPSILQRI
jgi:hypothetical protein